MDMKIRGLGCRTRTCSTLVSIALFYGLRLFCELAITLFGGRFSGFLQHAQAFLSKTIVFIS